MNRAIIGIPDSLPPEVAVLDVRRRGKPVQAAVKQTVIALDVSINAPRQVLVQGRGLDAELGGDLQISGTTAAPQVSGGFQLQRGSFTIASSKLNFDSSSQIGFDGTGLKKQDRSVARLHRDKQCGVRCTSPGMRTLPSSISRARRARARMKSCPSSCSVNLPSQLSALQLAEVGAALATLSGVGGSGGNPLTRLQKSLGLDRLSVGAGTTTTATGATENSGAAIQAGRYISKRVYIEGKQSTTGQSQVEIDVDLTKHLKLQTRLGNGTAIQGTTPDTDPGSSVGLSYQFEY